VRLIRRQFGDKFADALAKSPTLVKDLELLRAAGVKIRKVGGHCQAYSMFQKKVIYLGSKCNISYLLIALGHEKVHVLDSLTPNPTPRVTGRKEFVNMCLEAETDAIVHEVVIAEELLTAGFTVDDHSMKWVRRFRKGGRKAIRTAMNTAIASNTGEKYPEYYGGWYDEVLKPKDRLPVFAAATPDAESDTTDSETSGQSLVLLPEVEVLSTIQIPPAKANGRTLCPRCSC
jgi:hypothetical protein